MKIEKRKKNGTEDETRISTNETINPPVRVNVTALASFHMLFE